MFTLGLLCSIKNGWERGPKSRRFYSHVSFQYKLIVWTNNFLDTGKGRM